MPEMKRFPKKEIFSFWNFSVHSYDFIVPSGSKAWEAIPLVELRTIKKRWSDETCSYFEQVHYITISKEQMQSFIVAMNI